MPGLLLLGASIRAAAQSAARAGFHVVGGDLFADRDARRVADCHVVDDYPDGLLQLRARFPELPVAITGALENHPEMLDAFADLGDYWGNSSAVVRRIRDPFALQRFCELSGIPFPQTAKTCPRDPSRTWIQKAFSSAGGQRIGHELQQLDSPGYFQEYVDGEACSDISCSAMDEVGMCLCLEKWDVGC